MKTEPRKTRSYYRFVPCFSIVAAILVAACQAAHGQGSLDLRTWSQEGASTAGSWTVSTDGTNVFQSINGAPTYFVSPGDFIGTTFEGQFGVETGSDDDFIGFVFGLTRPLSSSGDPVNSTDFILFDWKQSSQSGAAEGFWLGGVSGLQNGIAGTSNQIWDKISDSDISFTKFGDPLINDGWEDNVVYDFELDYFANSIEIYMQGGTGTFATRQQVYNVDIGDLPSGTFPGDVFPTGRFGFYNHSQASVRYQSFTATVPEPMALIPMSLAALGFLVRRSRRKSVDVIAIKI